MLQQKIGHAQVPAVVESIISSTHIVLVPAWSSAMIACAWASRLPSADGDVIASVVLLRGEQATFERIGFRKECLSGSTSSNSTPLKVDSISEAAGEASTAVAPLLHYFITSFRYVGLSA